MKKLLLLIAFAVSSVILFSQSFDGGLTFGVNASHTTGTYVDSTLLGQNSNMMFNRSFSKPGLNVGVFTNLYLSKRSALDLEVAYTQKGSRKIPNANDTLPGTVYETRLSLHYITVPIHYKFIASDRITMFAGPNVGILVGHKFTQNFMDFSNYYDDLSKLDLSIDIGAEVFLLERLILNIKYSATFFLTPIRSYNNPQAWSYGPFSKPFWQRGQCNQLFGISLRWVFFGNKEFGMRKD
ncbi:PorT family protein [Odoribacter sp. OttesenSCG-928-L07]|nr:PorT family protein [Odoribacter sp. OttesenSCG-928-L07]MDL2238730.1 PorT family protein [Bacteroidales bacterium OttesenSCG-928-L14]MDL2241127.1 PorT family protein [Bacteroidales bacterium OttesenSCG-928-K22]